MSSNDKDDRLNLNHKKKEEIANNVSTDKSKI